MELWSALVLGILSGAKPRKAIARSLHISTLFSNWRFIKALARDGAFSCMHLEGSRTLEPGNSGDDSNTIAQWVSTLALCGQITPLNGRMAKPWLLGGSSVCIQRAAEQTQCTWGKRNAGFPFLGSDFIHHPETIVWCEDFNPVAQLISPVPLWPCVHSTELTVIAFAGVQALTRVRNFKERHLERSLDGNSSWVRLGMRTHPSVFVVIRHVSFFLKSSSPSE